MNKIEKIYRMRRNVLICAFICSVFLFCGFCFPISVIWGNLLHVPDNVYLFSFQIAGILAGLLLLFLFTRYLLFKTSTLKNPALRSAVDDERIRMNWLRAYRAAFYVIVGIHLIYLFFEGPMFEIGLPHAAWVSSSAGLMTFFSTAIFYTREVKSERS